jgi:predicted GIY-YIG superfamily endonuclease
MYQHKHGLIPGFTKRYAVGRLVYYDCTPNAAAAVAREREIKSWTREKKLRLIETGERGSGRPRGGLVRAMPGVDPSLRSG